MAVLGTPEASSGILNAIKGSLGLFGDTNKAESVDENSQAVPIDPYESSLDEKEIIELVSQWRRIYAVYERPVSAHQKLAFDYWIGKQKESTGKYDNDKTSVDNLIFEAVETFLPIATRANPEPLVQADPSDIGQKLSADLKNELVHLADTQKLRRKLAKATRSWLLNLVGIVKVTWNVHLKEIETKVCNPQKFIFDKDGYIDESGCFIGEYIGEKKSDMAKDLIEMFPKHRQFITRRAQGKMGTTLEYIEWWYKGRDVFYTMDEKIVLGKFKNPNWNWDGTEKSTDPLTGEDVETEIQGVNHLAVPTYPYRFLSVFSTDNQPHDNTSLILQNIPLQDRINKRERQIDDNVKNMNNGMIVSGRAFTESQAAQASAALRRGVSIRVPDGDVRTAVLFPERPSLPRDVFLSLQDARSELKNIFGTSGSTPQSVNQTDTVRGKILVNQLDASRIGGGITEHIEQLADAIYNLWVQMIFVFYDEEHYVVTIGQEHGNELAIIKNTDLAVLRTLDITVKEGSLIPKDPLTQRNEAIDLWSANAIDPRSLYKKLDFPDPDAAARQLILWQMVQKGQISPDAYIPNFSQSLPPQPVATPPGTPQQPGTGGPAVSPPGNAGVANATPGVPSPESVQAQGQQLLGSIPVH